MKALVAIVLAVILVATPTLSHAYYGGGEFVLVLGYLVYLGIAEVVKTVKSSGVEEVGTNVEKESGETGQSRSDAPTPKRFDGRCNVLPHTANCE